MTLKEYVRIWGLFILTAIIMGVAWHLARSNQWGGLAEVGAIFVPFTVFGIHVVGHLLTDRSTLQHALGKLSMQQALLIQHEEHIDALHKEKDQAYLERNYLVSALSRVFRAGTRPTDIEGWNPEWHGCVYIDLPSGQISFHYHSSQAHLFEKLAPWTERWDGHDKEEVFARITQFNAMADTQGYGLIPIATIMAWADRRIAYTATNPDIRPEEHATWRFVRDELELFTLRHNVRRLQGERPESEQY